MASSAASASEDLLQRLPRGRWPLVAGAFLAGWLLFAMVWLADRRQAPAEAVPVKAAAEAEPFEPLPRPMPAAGRGSTPMAPAADAPRLVDEPPAPADTATADATPLPPNIEEPAPPVAAAAVQPPAPLADQSPSPSYPPEAMRRSESGTVVVEVEIDPAGMPVSVEIGQRSGSRDLDRAAVQAVSRWRFEPARDASGNPVPGRLSIPIDFKLE